MLPAARGRGKGAGVVNPPGPPPAIARQQQGGGGHDQRQQDGAYLAGIQDALAGAEAAGGGVAGVTKRMEGN